MKDTLFLLQLGKQIVIWASYNIVIWFHKNIVYYKTVLYDVNITQN